MDEPLAGVAGRVRALSASTHPQGFKDFLYDVGFDASALVGNYHELLSLVRERCGFPVRHPRVRRRMNKCSGRKFHIRINVVVRTVLAPLMRNFKRWFTLLPQRDFCVRYVFPRVLPQCLRVLQYCGLDSNARPYCMVSGERVPPFLPLRRRRATSPLGEIRHCRQRHAR